MGELDSSIQFYFPKILLYSSSQLEMTLEDNISVGLFTEIEYIRLVFQPQNFPRPQFSD